MMQLLNPCLSRLVRCLMSTFQTFASRGGTPPCREDQDGIYLVTHDSSLFLSTPDEALDHSFAQEADSVRNMDVRPILQALEDNPDVFVSYAEIREGASNELLEGVEARLGIQAFHPVIRAFYQAHNGVCIRWSRVGGLMYTDFEETNGQEAIATHRAEAEREGTPQVLEVLDPDASDLMKCDGILFFPPVQDIFSSYSGDNDIDFLDDEFGAREAWQENLEDVEGFGDDSLSQPFQLNGEQYESKRALVKLLRYQSVTIEETKPMLLYETGNPDPNVFHVDADVTCIHDTPYNSKMPLSEYLIKALRHCGLVWRVDFWFRPPPKQFFPCPIAEDNLPIEENLRRVLAYLQEQQY